MILNLYAYKDDVAGEFYLFQPFKNDSLAIRAFKEQIKADGVPAEDLSLYKVGCMDTQNGVIYADFNMLYRGVKND